MLHQAKYRRIYEERSNVEARGWQHFEVTYAKKEAVARGPLELSMVALHR